MNPKMPDRELLPQVVLNEIGVPVFSYRRLFNPVEAGLGYTLQYTDDLSVEGGGWVALDLQQVAVTETSLGITIQVSVVDSTFIPGATAARFYRLVVD